MEIELIDYYPANDLNKPNSLGIVKVLLSKRMFIHMKVVRSSKSPRNVFCRFPSFKPEFPNSSEFLTWYGWVEDPQKERFISDEVIKQMKNKNLIG